MNKKRFEKHVSECNRLLSAYSNAGVDYFEGLMRFEQDEAAWKEGVGGEKGYTTFADCMLVVHPMKYHHYETFKRMVEVCGSIKEVRRIGMDGAKKLIVAPDDEPSIERPDVSVQHAVKEEFVAFRARNDRPVSGRQASSILSKHYRPTARAKGPVNKYDEMKAENAKLVAENTKLVAENTKLKKELAKCRLRCAELEKSKGKSRRK